MGEPGLFDGTGVAAEGCFPGEDAGRPQRLLVLGADAREMTETAGQHIFLPLKLLNRGCLDSANSSKRARKE
jgi:hypothetical protein